MVYAVALVDPADRSTSFGEAAARASERGI